VRVSATAFLFSVFVLWVVIGVVSAFVMGRRGHAPYPWLLIGAVLGPLVIPVALAQTRDEQRVGPPRIGSRPYRGPVDVLVGVDGSAESLAAADLVTRLLDERIGRLTLATVVNYEPGDVAESDARRRAEEELARVASDVRPRVTSEVDTVILVGRPDVALASYATEGQFDVLAVGRRGRGASKLVVGSVARRLSEHAPFPVLIANGSPHH
jgi:nucleotide-binding universal stress UspA family protein